jgi:phage terminase large subunit
MSKTIKIRIDTPRWAVPLVHKKPRYKAVYGGRSSGKSHFYAELMIDRCLTPGTSCVCIREVQKSLEQSAKRLLALKIQKFGLGSLFEVQNNQIKTPGGGLIIFQGMATHNAESIKSLESFDIAWIEEAQTLSDTSLSLLRPTIRKKGSEIWASWNPRFEDDPIDVFFRGEHPPKNAVIVKVNYYQNPWLPDESKEEIEHDKAYFKDKFDHIWLGEYFDTIENVLIPKAWFDACIDAHKTLGFKAEGIRYSSHDPADEGDDAKGFAFRHGSVVLDVQEKNDGDINSGCDWATDLALRHKSDAFTWDSIGVGAGLKRQIAKTFGGKPTILSQFVSSESADFPDNIFEPVMDGNIQHQQRNRDLFRNKRAQYYWYLRDRIYRTYRAVVHKEYHDPEKMIAFSSDIKILSKLRSEICRIPMKPNPNGFFELYSKIDMKSKFRIDSPNLADSVMMLMRVPTNPINHNVSRPKPIKPMGRR